MGSDSEKIKCINSTLGQVGYLVHSTNIYQKNCGAGGGASKRAIGSSLFFGSVDHADPLVKCGRILV